MKKDDNFGDCTKCIHSTNTEPHIWECNAEEYDIDTKSCWKPKEKDQKSTHKVIGGQTNE